MEIIYFVLGVIVSIYVGFLLLRLSEFRSLIRQALEKVMFASAVVSSKSSDLSYIPRLDRDLELMAVHAAGLGHRNLENSLRAVSREVQDALNCGGQEIWPKHIEILKEKNGWLRKIGETKPTLWAIFVGHPGFQRFVESFNLREKEYCDQARLAIRRQPGGAIRDYSDVGDEWKKQQGS